MWLLLGAFLVYFISRYFQPRVEEGQNIAQVIKIDGEPIRKDLVLELTKGGEAKGQYVLIY